jgi:ribonuclease E
LNPAASQSSLDPSDDLQELDLTNHPNYQDRGARGRRRRARRIGEMAPREAAPGKILRQSPASLTGGTGGMLVIESNGAASKKPEKVAPPERAKPSRVEGYKAREEVPPEVVAVTMTPEEQDVFAFMGISPLALFEGELKNPRTAVIKVNPPHSDNGYEASVGLETVYGEESVEEDESFDGRPFEEESAFELPSEPELPSPMPIKVITKKSTIAPKRIQQEIEESVDLEGEALEVASGAPRRRRRRSSAASSNGKQLSFDTDE